MWVLSVSVVIVSVLVLISNSVVVFFVYYFVQAIAKKLLSVDVNANVFSLLKHTNLKNKLLSQRITHTIYAKTSIILSIVLCFVLYNVSHTLAGLIVFFVICSVLQLLSTYFVVKSFSWLKGKAEYNL